MSRRRVRRQREPAPGARPETETAQISLTIAGRPLRMNLEVPAAPTRRRALLPVFRQIADVIVDIAVQQVETEGGRVSCTEGCGACCRQLVPISEPEAHAVRELVLALPEPRRTNVQARFAEARRRLDEAGLLESLLSTERMSAAELRALGLAYFRLSLACPFLEDESCSIHIHRPIACREYLVTSPPRHCARPAADTITIVPIPGKVSNAVSRTGATEDGTRWVALAIAPEWADGREEEASRPGRDLLEDFFRQLVR
jgi:Fe-S-cluster containining protein